MEMKAKIVVDVIFVFVALTPSLLHHNDVRVTYPTIFYLRMELVRFVPLYFVAMLQSMVIIIEVPFVATPIHIIVNVKSKP
jgi:hypothetical protein